MSRWRFGAWTVEITPHGPGPMGGYAARGDALSEGAHDPLTASVAILRDPWGQSMAWVALDVIAISDRVRRQASMAVSAVTGIPSRAVLLCASHTHCGPQAWFQLPGDHLAPATVAVAQDALVTSIEKCAREAMPQMSDVSVRFATAVVEGIGTNRHDPSGPHDASFGELVLVADDGQIMGVVLDFATHPTVLGSDTRQWSADYPGVVRRVLAARLDGSPPVLFLQGAAGDISTRFTRRAQTFDEVERLGGLLGNAAAEAIMQLPKDQTPIGRGIHISRDVIVVPPRPLPDVATAEEELRLAELDLAAVRARMPFGSPGERIACTRRDGARILRERIEEGLPEAIDVPVTVVAIDDVSWIHMPAELFAAHGLRIRAESPFSHTRVIGYTDGYRGYLPDEKAFHDDTYEARVSQFDLTSTSELVQAVIAQTHLSFTESHGLEAPSSDSEQSERAQL